VAVQEAVVGELKQKHRQIKEKKVLNRDEVYHGALEDILMGVYKCSQSVGIFYSARKCYTSLQLAYVTICHLRSSVYRH